MIQKGQEIRLSRTIFNQDVGVLLRNGFYGFMRKLCLAIDSQIRKIQDILPKTRTSHPLSKALRPVFSHSKIRLAFGANLAGAMILVGSVSAAPGVVETFPEAEVGVLKEEVVVATTEPRFVAAVNTLGLSQGYRGFHRAIDLRARVGTPVVAIDDGKVVELVKGRFGYGHYVSVSHADGFGSLYAHLGRIDVSLGEMVKQGQKLGVVGMTGWSTGAHLHLEIFENGKAINPVSVMPVK